MRRIFARPAWAVFTVLLGLLSIPAESAGPASPVPKPDNALTLPEALARALNNSPELEAFDWEIRAREGDILQAGLWPNPELNLEIEDIRFGEGPRARETAYGLGLGRDTQAIRIPRVNGDPVSFNVLTPTFTPNVGRAESEGPAAGFREAEYTIMVRQQFELGGKRARRVRVAELGQDLARWDYEAARARVLVDTAKRFNAALVAQEEQALWSDLARLAGEALESVKLEAEAGKAAEIDVLRSETIRDTTATEATRVARDLEAARIALASMWGSTAPGFDAVAGGFHETPDLPDLDTLVAASENNPDVARWQSEVAQREATHLLARAKRIPDLNVGVGMKARPLRSTSTFEAGLDPGGLEFGRTAASYDRNANVSFVLEFGIALPVFDRNQGNILAAERRVNKAYAEERQTRREVESAIRVLHANARAVFEEAQTIARTILPRVERTYALTREGYEAGRYRIFDLLDAERSLVETRIDLMNSTADYRAALLELQYLGGLDWDIAESTAATPESKEGDNDE